MDASDILTPDIGGVYRGPEGVARFWREWLAAWETLPVRLSSSSMPEIGSSCSIDQRMRGRSTGIEVPLGEYAQRLHVPGRH